MSFSTIYTLFLIFTYICSSYTEKSILYAEDTLIDKYGTIIHSSLIFRHGERTVINSFPTDPYPLSIWREGTGQLTQRGKEQAYKLGKWFHQRYRNTLMANGYRFDLLWAESSDVDRTLMSGELVLAGSYPPTKKEMWSDDDLRWQPVPIHTAPPDYENKIGDSAICDRIDYETDLLNTIPELQNKFLYQSDFIEQVQFFTGKYIDSNDIYSAYKSLWDIYDCLFIEESHNLTLPNWTINFYPEPLKTVASLQFRLQAYSPELRRLRSGPLLKNITEDMLNKTSSSRFNETIHFYSGHDTTIASLLISLGVYNLIPPPYSAAVIIELRKKNDQYLVTVLYRNSSEVPPYLLEIPACGSICTLDKFIEITKPLIPENWREECVVNIGNRLQNLSVFDILVLISAVGTTIIVALIIVRVCVERRRKDYSPF